MTAGGQTVDSGLDSNPGGSAIPSGDDLAVALREFKKRGDQWARYNWARQFVSGRDVLEWGCGHGLGVPVLAGEYSSYIGIDVDSSAVAWAATHVGPACKGSSFRSVQEFEALSLRRKFPVILLFEVIEHVPEPAKLLTRIRGHLAPGGLLILSTPNGAYSRHDPLLFNSDFHFDEYSIHEILKIVGDAGATTTEVFGLNMVLALDGIALRAMEIRRRIDRDARGATASNRAAPGAPTPPPSLIDRVRMKSWDRIQRPGLWRVSRLRQPYQWWGGPSHFLVKVGFSGAA